jgi:purine-nucleoside phosphorylase
MPFAYEHLKETAEAVSARSGGQRPRVGIILGSGLSRFAEELKAKVAIPYGELPHFPTSSVAGHPGRLVLGNVGFVPVAVLQGRVHGYEGYAPWQVAYPARVLCALGIERLLVTNAAGGIAPHLHPGALMAISDHINFSGFNALTGPHDGRLGPRFVDLSRAYHPELLALLHQAASRAQVPLQQGVYAMLSGPSYETPAEIRALRVLGADAVGMSTVPEVVAAAQMGVKVAGISCIANLAAGIAPKPLSHAEVSEVAERAAPAFSRLLTEFIAGAESSGSPA